MVLPEIDFFVLLERLPELGGFTGSAGDSEALREKRPISIFLSKIKIFKDFQALCVAGFFNRQETIDLPSFRRFQNSFGLVSA